LYIVTYDLNQLGQNYECIIKKLKAIEPHWHFQKSVWLVAWDGNAYSLAEHLNGCLDSNDTLLVSLVTEDSAWCGLSKEGSDWISSFI